MIEGLHGFQKMSKIASSKALVIRVNLVFLALFFVVYVALFLQPSASVYYQNAGVSIIRCSFRDCHHKGKVRLSPSSLCVRNQRTLPIIYQSN